MASPWDLLLETRRILQNIAPEHKSPRVPYFLLLAFALLSLGLGAAHAELPAPVRDGLRAADIPEDAISLHVSRLSDRAVTLAHRDVEPMPPASTLKLLTSLVALERLGPAWRARTLLRTRGKIVDGVLGGDLVLQGGGDVDFDWLAFERQLALLRLRGVREIRGDLILDLTRFRPSRSDIGVAPFDESPEFRYNVVPDALLLNTYLLQLDIASTTEAVHVVSTPLLDRVSVVPELDLIDGPCEDWEDGWKPPVVDDRRGTMTIRLRGTFPRECVASTAVNVLDRGAYADRLFRALWKRLGGKFTGHVRESIGPSYARVIGEHSSRPLAQVLWDVNKRSDNPITRVTYLNLGATSGACSA
jgi:D-alanyl-D-alanine carboxypeptidase/D-alanyl-D-alanine-endopeptidase (penicillin-binding protein 4)